MTNPTIDYFIFTNTNNPTSEIQSAPYLFYYLWSPNSGEDYLHQLSPTLLYLSKDRVLDVKAITVLEYISNPTLRGPKSMTKSSS